MQRKYKVFDIHTHVYPEAIATKATESLGEFYVFHVNGNGTYADLESQAAENNVVGFLLLSVATNMRQVCKVNDAIASSVSLSCSHGFKTVGFAGMHQDFDDFAGELDRVESIGLRGVKIHPDIQGVDIDDPRLLKLYELMEGRMPLYLHMGDNRPQYRFSEAKKLSRVLDMYPRLVVVAAHLGGYMAWDEAEKYLAGRKNVWYDTSSALWAMSTEKAEHMVKVLGAENIMFGTDYPVVDCESELERLLKLRLTEKEREDILYNNAARFLSLDK